MLFLIALPLNMTSILVGQTTRVLLCNVKRFCKQCSLKHRWNVSRHFSAKTLHILHNRGLIQSVFPDNCPDLPQLLGKGQQCFYSGFDPTSDSLHLGHLVVLMTLLHFQREGHKIIALIGGATARIGDPSGHSSDRELLEARVVEKNADSLKENLQRIFKNHDELFWKNWGRKESLEPPLILNNFSWYWDKHIVPFLETVGRQFRMGELLSRRSVKARLNSPNGMCFTEFTYQLFQSYDWCQLFDKYHCLFQVGGADQLGNIHSGHDLLKRIRHVTAYGFFVPLITNEMGDKYGKSSGSPVWLNKEKTSPFEFYQFFLKLPDVEVDKFLRLFTFYQLPDIQNIVQKHLEKPDNRYGQKKIAENITLLVHGEEGLASAKRTTEALFHSNIESLAQLKEDELCQVFKHASFKTMILEPGMTLLDLGLKANCFKSIEDAQRIIEAGGFYINHIRAMNAKEVITADQHILPNGITLARVGKKNYYCIKWH